MGLSGAASWVTHAVRFSCAPCTWEQSQGIYVKAPKVWAPWAESIHPINGHPLSFAGGGGGNSL